MTTDATTMPAIPLRKVESSQIEAIGYDAETETLAIRFKAKKAPGSLYHYRNFAADDFAAFNRAESKGSYFIKTIKPAGERWPFRKIAEAE